MYPASNLAESPPKETVELPSGQLRLLVSPRDHTSTANGTTLENHVLHQHDPAASPPVRKDTTSSTSTTSTAPTLPSLASTDTVATERTIPEASPSFRAQAVFSVRDGNDIASQRRPSRRRTGPLTPEQREKAALIRKVGACPDCRRRRVACHPSHRTNTSMSSWEDALRKYKSHSPAMQEIAPQSRRLPSPPVPLNSKPVFTHEPQEMEKMDIDASPPRQRPGGVPPPSELRIRTPTGTPSRTPLPSGPRPDKPLGMAMLPGIESLKTDLQGSASRILSNPHRSRYTMAAALLVDWQDDDDHGARNGMNELGNMLHEHYNYTFQIKSIPSSSDGCKSSWRWLSREVTDFIDGNDHRDVLKIVYYGGHSYLDGNREMVLASSKQAEPSSAIRWSGIQQILEGASSDTLIIMDAPYYPSSKLVRQEGVLELIAASASEDHVQFLDRSAFTRALTEQLRTRASQKFMSPLSAAELHAKLLSFYPKMIQDRNPEKEMVTSFPSPLHIQVSGGTHLSLTFRLADDNVNLDSWVEWLRSMPEGIREVKVEGPYRNTFR
ncbi:hypothetical protein B0T17DRAFT_589689 [Bombardia bombarda]|uniref:Uncharacterized protein n=1 Tax=Bombardia bombarda TaxID=252184 RepID=A0AA39XA08_9PEZI|nr:hypothetical protein B0T17DRAFT_589689 [Bombardia bombarda]